MQQRRPRLGDIVDDYCPRERRITNHAVVAMIEDEVKQTRCTTCDADHEYKQAKVPAQRRKKDAAAGGPGDLLATPPRKKPVAEAGDAGEAGDTVAADTADVPDPIAAPMAPLVGDPVAGDASGETVPLAAAAPEPAQAFEEPAEEQPASTSPEDDGPVHRRLIRATLPRPEGQAPERKLPDFTMHQREVNGNRSGRGPRRGPRPGQVRAQQGNGQPPRFGGQRQGPGGGQRHGSGHGGQHGQRPPGAGTRGGHGQGQPGQPRHNRNRKRGR